MLRQNVLEIKGILSCPRLWASPLLRLRRNVTLENRAWAKLCTFQDHHASRGGGCHIGGRLQMPGDKAVGFQICGDDLPMAALHVLLGA